MDPAVLAQALLSKVERDFGSVAASTTPPAVCAAQRDLPTLELALPADDPDLLELTPWYTRFWRAVFGG